MTQHLLPVHSLMLLPLHYSPHHAQQTKQVRYSFTLCAAFFFWHSFPTLLVSAFLFLSMSQQRTARGGAALQL